MYLKLWIGYWHLSICLRLSSIRAIYGSVALLFVQNVSNDNCEKTFDHTNGTALPILQSSESKSEWTHCEAASIGMGYPGFYGPPLNMLFIKHEIPTLITSFTGGGGLTWGAHGAHWTQVGPMLAPWILLSGYWPWFLIWIWKPLFIFLSRGKSQHQY